MKTSKIAKINSLIVTASFTILCFSGTIYGLVMISQIKKG